MRMWGHFGGLPMWLSGKEYSSQSRRCRTCKFEWQPTPIFLPGKSHGQKSLKDYSPWGQKKLAMTEWLSMHTRGHFYSQGNGNPHSGILAWKIPWIEEHCRLQSMGSQRVGHDWATSLSLSFTSKKYHWFS